MASNYYSAKKKALFVDKIQVGTNVIDSDWVMSMATGGSSATPGDLLLTLNNTADPAEYLQMDGTLKARTSYPTIEALFPTINEVQLTSSTAPQTEVSSQGWKCVSVNATTAFVMRDYQSGGSGSNQYYFTTNSGTTWTGGTFTGFSGDLYGNAACTDGTSVYAVSASSWGSTWHFMKSTDYVNWTLTDINTLFAPDSVTVNSVYDINYVSGKLVINYINTMSERKIAYSTDSGATWTHVAWSSLGVGFGINGAYLFVVNDVAFAYINTAGSIGFWYSANLTTWTQITGSSFGANTQVINTPVAYDSSTSTYYVYMGEKNIKKSTDLTTWTSVNITGSLGPIDLWAAGGMMGPQIPKFPNLAADGGVLYAISSNYEASNTYPFVVVYSTDSGTSWTYAQATFNSSFMYPTFLKMGSKFIIFNNKTNELYNVEKIVDLLNFQLPAWEPTADYQAYIKL